MDVFTTDLTISAATQVLTNTIFSLLPWIIGIVLGWIVIPRLIDNVKEEQVKRRNRKKLLLDGIVSLDKPIIVDGFEGTVVSIGETHVKIKNGTHYGYFSIASLLNGRTIVIPKVSHLIETGKSQGADHE